MDLWQSSESIIYCIFHSVFFFLKKKKFLVQHSRLMWAGLTLTPQSSWVQIFVLLPSSLECETSCKCWRSLLQLSYWPRGDAVPFRESKSSCRRSGHEPVIGRRHTGPAGETQSLLTSATASLLAGRHLARLKGEVHAYFIEQVYYSY